MSDETGHPLTNSRAAGVRAGHEPDPRVGAARLDNVMMTSPPAILGAYGGACILLAMLDYLYRVPPRSAIAWAALQSAAFVLRGGTVLYYWRAGRAAPDWRPWARALVFSSAFSGLVWGVGSLELMSAEGVGEELLIVLVISAVASGSVLSLGAYLPATLAFLIPLALSVEFSTLSHEDTFHIAFAFLENCYLLILGVLAFSTSRNFIRSQRLALRNVDLIHDLSLQKEAAEQASLAKSRFLAAASHDLRQPVHALTMFVGALRERPLDAASARLVEQISASVEAMDGLFSSLLDMSQLDAGVVKPSFRAFALGPLLERVCGDFVADADKKGLVLTDCPTRAIVRTDPVLLENILRNIVSNALRYTDSGRILVGVRRGPRVRIEILDTGRGIAEENLGRVFDEFYQVGNPERDRGKGLGLGLAIVRRTAALIDCRVEIRSRLGRGTRVSLFVPRANELEEDDLAAEAPVAAGARPGLIFLIDDEAPIREAMTTLIDGWGHRTIAAESGARMLELAAACPDRPDLVIADFRLRDGENGIELIKRLKMEYNEDIPGILLTGDTGPRRLREAGESGFLLLHKPISGGKLRAAIQSRINGPVSKRKDPASRDMLSDQRF